MSCRYDRWEDRRRRREAREERRRERHEERRAGHRRDFLERPYNPHRIYRDRANRKITGPQSTPRLVRVEPGGVPTTAMRCERLVSHYLRTRMRPERGGTVTAIVPSPLMANVFISPVGLTSVSVGGP